MKMSEIINETKPHEDIILERIKDIQGEVRQCKQLMDNMIKTLDAYFEKRQENDKKSS